MNLVDLVPQASGNCEALGICDAGFVAGVFESLGFRWSPQPAPGGSLQTIRPLTPLTAIGIADTSCRALAVNNAGLVVGVSDALQGPLPNFVDVKRAFRWDPNVSPLAVDLGTLIPDPNNPDGFIGNSEARAVNNNRWIVGVSDVRQGGRHACLWLPVPDPSTGRTIIDLGTLIQDGQVGVYLGNSEANAVNDDNIIVGVSDAKDSNGQSVRRGFDWKPTDQTPRPFGTFAVQGANVFGSSSANAINAQGVTVGRADSFGVGGALFTQAFRSFPGGHVITGLPLIISPNILATGINNDAPNPTIVGYFGVGPTIATARAFTYQIGAANLTDLTNTLGLTPWTVHLSTGINVAGATTGIATNPFVAGAKLRAVLLQ